MAFEDNMMYAGGSNDFDESTGRYRSGYAPVYDNPMYSHGSNNPNQPAPVSSNSAGPNYTYQYADGTTGTNMYQSGVYGQGPEGWFVGTKNQDGSTTQGIGANAAMSTLGYGNVDIDPNAGQVGGASFGARAGSGGSGGSQSNPYIGGYANAVTNQVTQNLQRNILPGISSGAMAAGGYGGSRQGVVEANALNDANQGLSNALAGMYSQDWNAQQGRDLQRYGMDQSYNLGLGNLGLNAQNSQNSFYTAQRGQDMQQAGLGAQLAQMANQGYLNQGSGLYDTGSMYQNAPWNTMGQFNQAVTPYTGYGATSTVSQSTNPWAQALGGAMLGGQLGRLF